MRHVRNWWLRCRADGQQRHVQFGPQAGDGGFFVEVYQRIEGRSEIVGRLTGEVMKSDTRGVRLVLSWESHDWELGRGDVRVLCETPRD